MSDKFSFRGGDTEGVADGDYVLAISGGHVTGLSPAQAGEIGVFDTLPPVGDYTGELVIATTGDAIAPMLGSDGVHPNDAGMTHVADAYVDALAGAGKTPAAGTLLTAYGDSWTAHDTMCTPGMRAVHQLRDRLGLTLDNEAQGFYQAADCAGRAIGTAGTFVAGTGGVVLVGQAGFNDLKKPDTTLQRTATENALRALFATLCAAERIEQTAFTFSGTWIDTANTGGGEKYSGGSNARCDTDGATATVSITTPGTHYLLLQGTDGTTGWIGGQFTISQGGTTLATIDTNAQCAATTSNGLWTINAGPLAVRLDGVAAGTLTITFNTLGRTGAKGYLDALVRISDTPPTILASKPLQSAPGSAQDNPTLLAHIRSLYDALATEFGPNVVVADAAPGWYPTGRASDPNSLPELWYSNGTDWLRPVADIPGDVLLADMADVDTTTTPPADGNALLFDATSGLWLPGAPPTGGAGVTIQDENGNVGTGVMQLDFQGAGVSVAAGTGEVVVTIPGATSGSAVKDRRWNAPAGATVYDEFNDDSLAAAWTRVDGTGAPVGNATWIEGADVLSVENTGGDAGSTVHGLVRALGTPVAVGDAFITCVTVIGSADASFSIGGLVVSDGTTHGVGKQVLGMTYLSASGTHTTNTQACTNWSSTGSAGSLVTPTTSRLFVRLVCTAANTWRTDISPDGVGWIKGLATASQTFTPTHVGLISSSWGTATKSVASYEFLRRVAGIS